jgi:methyl-accepting chemotaxis protein
MGHVVVVADQAGTASKGVLEGAAEIGQEATTLRTQVDRFLEAVRNDSGERRRFERIDGGNIRATLHLPGRNAASARVRDISAGGVALDCDERVAHGLEVSLELPAAGGAVTGTVIRSDGTTLALAFDEDEATRARVRRAIGALGNAEQAA